MTMRPGQAKGPNVALMGAPAAAAYKVKVTGADPVADYLAPSLVAGAGIALATIGGGVDEKVEITCTITDTDIKAKVSATDTTTDYLDSKITAGTGISKAIQFPAGNEKLQLSCTVAPDDHKVLVSATDPVADYLAPSLVAGAGISLATIGGGVDEKVEITCTITDTDIKAKVSATDTTTDYLNSKIVAGTGITKTILTPGGNETLEIKVTGALTDVNVKVDAADTTTGYLADKLVGLGQTMDVLNASGNEQIENRNLPVFNDPFYVSDPFWVGTQMITSGDFSVDTVNHRINGIAQNNQDDWYRVAVPGDFDHVFKLDMQSASSMGMWVYGNSLTSSFKVYGGNIVIAMTGESDTTIAYAGTVMWFRIRRVGRSIRYYYRASDDTSWTLAKTHTKDLGHDVKCALDSMTNGRVLAVWLHDNASGQVTRGVEAKVIPMTDQATITPDLRMGSIYTVTLAASRTMGAPTANQEPRGTKFILRIRQGGSGSYTISWNAAYRFPGGTSPTLTTAVGKTDYFGFVYNETDSVYDCIAEAYNL